MKNLSRDIRTSWQLKIQLLESSGKQLYKIFYKRSAGWKGKGYVSRMQI